MPRFEIDGMICMIPKVIHYCWFGGKPLPGEVRRCIASWKKYCPDFRIQQWDETNFDVHGHPFVSQAYDAKAWAFVSDFARLKIISEQGGIYLDTDVELLKPLNDLCKHRGYLAIQQGCFLINTGLGFGAEAGHPVIAEMLRCYDEIIYLEDQKAKISCPFLNTMILEKYGYKRIGKSQIVQDIHIYAPCYFDPYASSDDAQNLMCKDTISIHHYSATWASPKQQLKRKIARFLGENTVLWIKHLLHK